jgi:hypothetical protein
VTLTDIGENPHKALGIAPAYAINILQAQKKQARRLALMSIQNYERGVLQIAITPLGNP